MIVLRTEPANSFGSFVMGQIIAWQNYGLKNYLGVSNTTLEIKHSRAELIKILVFEKLVGVAALKEHQTYFTHRVSAR